MQQKLWLKDFEHHINAQTWIAAEALLQAGAVKNLREVEKHFWVALVASDEGHFETEMIITPHKIKAFTCECFGEGRRLICPHIAASLLKLRQFLEQRLEERRVKAELQEHKERSRLTVQDALENATPEAITEFVLEYARRDRDFSLALKTWFAGLVTATENPYLLVLESVIPKGKNFREPEFRRLRKTLDDLSMQADSAFGLRNFQTAFQINAAVLRKIGAFLPLNSETRYTNLLQYYQTALQQLFALEKDQVAQELRDAIWDLLFEQGRTGHLPAESQREAIRYLSKSAGEAHKFEQFNRLFDETPAPAPPFILHLFVVALAERGAASSVARVLEDFLEQPEKVKNAILILYYLHYWEAVTLAGEAFLNKEGLSAGWRREMEDILLFIAEQTGDTERQRALLRQRFLLSGSFEFYEKLKRASGAEWTETREELATTLQARGERHKLASMLALDQEFDALAQLLQEETDIRQLQRFEALFLTDHRAFVRDRYVVLMGDYLIDHFGQPAAAYVRQQLAVLLQKGEPELVREIILALTARYSDRTSLPEELAELFPKTKKRVLL
ncbi:MAG TPA: hypothetical protein PLO67_03960 [Saprospiraceae bacterium]|nr:hypothetical protein [Saprospiraceae bacterium]HPI05110.1 hypothetical protein [Saprospiraceae bacterium]